jgi:hypothetical protein
VADWADLKVLGQRVFRHYLGGKGRWLDLQATLHRLIDPGRPTAAIFGDHVVGFVRPWVFADVEFAPPSEPAMMARASGRGFHLISPLLLANVEDCRRLLRKMSGEEKTSPKEWRCYSGECPADPMGKLFFAGNSGLRTELEHQLTLSFGPEGRARQSYTRPDAARAS